MKISHYYGKSVSSTIHATLIESNNIKIYYSYDTIIAVEYENELTIAKNSWGSVTGKHLNAINRDKSIRVDLEILQNIINKIEIIIKV